MKVAGTGNLTYNGSRNFFCFTIKQVEIRLKSISEEADSVRKKQF